jgi:hypothetical protein
MPHDKGTRADNASPLPLSPSHTMAARRSWLHPRFNISTMQNKVEALYRLMLENKYADAA